MKTVTLKIHGPKQLLAAGWTFNEDLQQYLKNEGWTLLFVGTPGQPRAMQLINVGDPQGFAALRYSDTINYCDKSAIDWGWSPNQVGEITKHQDRQTCSCHIHILMREGCKCGAIQNERREMK
jgi:hypothetical protein